MLALSYSVYSTFLMDFRSGSTSGCSLDETASFLGATGKTLIFLGAGDIKEVVSGSLGFGSSGGKISFIIDFVVTETSVALGGTMSGVFSASRSSNDKLYRDRSY